MNVSVDIEAVMRSKERSFHLRVCFESSDNAVVFFGPSGSGKTLTLQATMNRRGSSAMSRGMSSTVRNWRVTARAGSCSRMASLFFAPICEGISARY